ncbi:MAG: GGDEF domain-containing protein [Chloroflexi bacterium]|nr:GGDEF domain-containing protein [Chloroflexota bacterium]
MADSDAASLTGVGPSARSTAVSGAVGLDPRLDLAALPDPRRSYPRLVAVLTALTVPLILATAGAQVGGGYAFRDVVGLGIGLLAAAGLATRLPWTDHDGRWLGLIVAIQIVFVASLNTMTGGGGSPYFALYAPILALAGWYLRIDLVLASVALVAATEAWRAVAIETGGSAEQLMIALPLFAGLAAISWLTADRMSRAIVTVRHDQVVTAAVLEGVRAIGAEPTDDPIGQLVDECERIFGGRAGIVTFQGHASFELNVAVPTTGGAGYLRIPVSGARATHGLLQLWREEPFGVNEVRLAGILAGAAAKAADARWLLERVREESERDALTGLLNRRAFDRDLAALLAERVDGQLLTGPTLFFLDVDGFKAWNDAHGHAEGDRLLERLGAGLLSMVRHGDRVYRYGGDEFAVLARDLTAVEADGYAARLRTVPEALRSRRADDPTGVAAMVPTSLSVGVARAGAPGPTDAKDLLRAADAAMYVSKRTQAGQENPLPESGTRGPSTA